MKLLGFEKVHNGKYLKQYELTYLNKNGREKKYEMASRREWGSIEDIGGAASGVSIVATCQGKFLLLKEFRMGVNRDIYNLCAGMLEEGESVEECIARELYEETGLSVKKILKILPPSFATVAISDTTTYIAFVEAEGEIGGEASENEQIEAGLYTKEEIGELLREEAPFSSRAQMAAYFFTCGAL